MITSLCSLLSVRPWLSLLLLGALSALAHAPIFWVWLLPVTFGPALWLMLQRQTAIGSIGAAFLFALGHFVVGMYWLAAPLYVAPQNVPFGLIGSVIGTPIALLGIPSAIALCFALPLGLSLYVVGDQNRRTSWLIVALAASAWACGDWLRSWVLTGLPWNITGYVWGWPVPMMQSVAWIGPYGLSLLTAIGAFSPALILVRRDYWLPVLGVCLVLIGLLYLAGLWRLASVELTEETGTRVGMVQPVASQNLSRDSNEILAAVTDLLTLSATLADDIDVAIWSEGATGLELYRGQDVYQRVTEFTTGEGPVLLTGSAKFGYQVYQPGDLGASLRVTNTLSVVVNGDIVAEHDKAHLVPFGEYMPLRRLLTLPNLSLPGADYTKGPGVQTLRIPGLPGFSPLICYEAIFPGRVIDRTRRPEWLVNITTDAWFGNTSGPRQHLTSVRYRAIEEGLPLVRVAGAGISAVIDPFGRIEKAIDLNIRGAVAASLPGHTGVRPLFAAGGQVIVVLSFWVFLAWLVLAIFVNLRRPKNNS